MTKAYLQEPQVIRNLGREYVAGARTFQGVSSLACGRGDRLWAVWYGGPTPAEDQNNYVLLAVSEDHGETWSDEILAIDPDGPGPVTDRSTSPTTSTATVGARFWRRASARTTSSQGRRTPRSAGRGGQSAGFLMRRFCRRRGTRLTSTGKQQKVRGQAPKRGPNKFRGQAPKRCGHKFRGQAPKRW